MTVNSWQLIFGYFIVFSLIKMNVFHNLVLFWCVWGVLQRKLISQTAIYVSYYAGFFVIVKYIYTLVPQFNGHSAECFIIQQYNLCTSTERIMYTIGFDSNYNPITLREYFRYVPSLFEWLFVLAAFLQLRRQQTIGND